MSKLISIVIPVFNEQDCLTDLYSRVTNVMCSLNNYEYEIVFYDDGSTDESRRLIEELCYRDIHVKAVFYAKNFGTSQRRLCHTTTC